MGNISSILFFLLFVCFCLKNIQGNPIGTSAINCERGSNFEVGEVNEGYNGPVEELTGIPTGNDVQLVDHLFPLHLQFLELRFTPGSSTATVTTKKDLDADALKSTSGILYYSIMCVGTKLNNTRTLRIKDLNDNPPIFTSDTYNETISEALLVGSTVVKVEAEDADATLANNRVHYCIMPPEPNEFEIRNDGSILLKQRLNYNMANVHSFTVEARDDGGLSDTALVTITVEDFDNMNPYFTHNLYTAVIREEQTGPFHTILPEAIEAKDGDTGINQPIVYSISTVSPSKYSSHFNISATSGIITVVTQLDREEVDMVTLTIKAAQNDDSLKTADATVSVKIEDVNDNPPEFDKSSYSATILENSPTDSFILRATITDRDEGGFNGTLNIIPDSVPFSVTPEGILQVKNSSALDREKIPSFTFQIEARENAAPNQAVRADVNITLLDENDNSPQFGSSTYEGKIFKNQTVDMVVTKVEAVDPDEGVNGEVKYAIVGGNQDGHFSIDETTGEIHLRKLVILEENKVLRFLLYVTAKDGGQVPRVSSALVDILAPGDTRPQFLMPTYHGSIQEERDPPVQILKVGFLSGIPVIDVTLEVLTEQDKFSIDSQGVFSTLVKLDYEAQKNYSVQVSISDGTNRDEATVVVDVTDINDNNPVFPSSLVQIKVAEDTKVGTNLTELGATDADDGFNGKISYSLLGGEGKFSIDPKSARIYLARELDRETQSQFNLDVIAQDQGQPPRSATANVVINVTDVNDNAPMFSMTQYELEILENATVGLTVFKLSATDLDQGTNAEVTYRIIQQNPPTETPVFTLNAASGDLQLSQPLDFSKVRGYTLIVAALDGGSPSLNGTSSVLVRVLDLNNNEPEFSREKYDITAFENLPGGTALITLEVTDKDEGGFSNGHFILKSDTFSINKQGTVFLNSNATLDREEQDNYVLQVVAVDSPTDGLSATAQLNITVLDINDNNPQFTPIPDPIRIPEGEYSPESPGEVCRITATDLDQGDNGKVTLSLSSSDSNKVFQLREDGTLLAVAPLDREKKDAYVLVIVASDHGTPQRKNITDITVTIMDVNDNDPEFSQKIYTKDILVKDAKKGDVVLTLSASDKDLGNNSLITYSFLEGSPLLHLNSETGLITLATDLSDITENTLLNLTALASDHGDPPRTSTATVLVSLMTISLTPGVDFEKSAYNFSIAENEPESTEVGTVKALTGSSAVSVTYTLRSHTDVFSVDDQGRISTLQVLDKETQEWYSMAVEAVDSRIPPNTAVTMVRVQVANVNEPPEFNRTSYSAKIFSIAPYKYPVVQVKATDQDIGENGELQYSLGEDQSLFDVDPSTGQVYVVSVEGEKGQVSLLVKATDPHGLSATAKVEVTIQESTSSDTVVMSLNQPANIVEKKVPEVEGSLGQALGWSIKVISVISGNSFSSRLRASRDNMRTYLSFIAMDSSSSIVPSEQVKSKLETERVAVEAQLEIVFGEVVDHVVETSPGTEDSSNETAVIALSVLLALSIIALVVLVVVTVVRNKKPKSHEDSFNDFSIGNPYCQHKNSDTESTNSSKRPDKESQWMEANRRNSDSDYSHTNL